MIVVMDGRNAGTIAESKDELEDGLQVFKVHHPWSLEREPYSVACHPLRAAIDDERWCGQTAERASRIVERIQVEAKREGRLAELRGDASGG